MYANHARAAELKAARARRAQEDAARVVDEQDQILEAIPSTLEQFIVTGNRGRTTRSSTSIGRIDGLRQNAQNMEHTSEAASENELSDSAADFMPASSQASCSHVSTNNQSSERMTHSVLRPSFSRTAQGYDTPQSNTVVHMWNQDRWRYLISSVLSILALPIFHVQPIMPMTTPSPNMEGMHIRLLMGIMTWFKVTQQINLQSA